MTRLHVTDARAFQDALHDAPRGARITLDAKRYRLDAALRLIKDVEIVGPAILDGSGLHGIVELLGMNQRYAFRGVTFENGFADAGGAVSGMNENRVDFEACRFVGNRARTRGAAVSLLQTTGRFRRCVFARNVCLGATCGGALEIGLSGSIDLDRSIFVANEADVGGAVFLGGTAALRVRSCTFVGNRARRAHGGSALFAFGATSSGPSAHVSNSVFAERAPLATDPSKTCKIMLTHSIASGDLPEPWFEDLGHNTREAPELVELAPDAWALTARSPGAGTADARLMDADATDPMGQPLIRDGRADPGAFSRAI